MNFPPIWKRAIQNFVGIKAESCDKHIVKLERGKRMNRFQARQIDTSYEVIFDESGVWCVCGVQSKFGYTTHMTREQAEDRMKRMTYDLTVIEQDNYETL